MSKDAAAIPADEPHSGIITIAARRKFCVLTLLLGAFGGMLVGILNLLAANYQWDLQDNFFDIVDAPISSLMPAPNGMFSVFVFGFVIICYWEVITLFLAWLICLVRTRVIRDIIRDKICRYILFFGICCGIFAGSLSFLAASNGWDVLSLFFDSLNEPVNSVMDALQNQYSILDSLPEGPGTEFVFRNTVDVVYWTIIGLLLALLPCVVRILKRRKAAREKQVVRGMIALCQSGAPEQASKEGLRES